MKFKYVGEDDCFCIELLAYKLVPKGSYLKNGQVINVPNDNKLVISALETSGLFKEVKTKRKVSRKVKKEDKK